MRSSTLIIIAAGLLSATTFKWSKQRMRSSMSDLYREAKAGRLRTSPYRKVVSLVSWILIIVGMYLAFSGD
jgi:hypothetical protein